MAWRSSGVPVDIMNAIAHGVPAIEDEFREASRNLEEILRFKRWEVESGNLTVQEAARDIIASVKTHAWTTESSIHYVL